MTRLVLKAATQFHLHQVRLEVVEAHKEKQITTPWFESCLAQIAALSTSIAGAADEGPDVPPAGQSEQPTRVLRSA